MRRKHAFFKPDRIDEQVDQFSPDKREKQPANPQSTQVDTRQFASSAHLVQELQAYYQAELQHNQAFLEHAWQEIAARQPTHQIKAIRKTTDETSFVKASPKRIQRMKNQQTDNPQPEKPFIRKVGLLAATLVTVLLVGLLITVLAISHTDQHNPIASGLKATPTRLPTPTATTTSPASTVVHTQVNVSGVSWSPDSTRIASLTYSQGTTRLQIWNATTGSTLLTVPFATSFDEADWSPTGQYLALSNLQTIAIVNSQTGQTVSTLTYDANVALNPRSSAQRAEPLSSFVPDGNGYGFYSVAWSPDGSSLAVAISYFTSGKVELLNPLTGAVKTSISSPYAIAIALAFSSDGRYLAANYSNDSRVLVWSVATHALVFQQASSQALNIGWQPGTHNLAVSFYSSGMKVWNTDTKKLLNTYARVEGFAWSPDGKELATYAAPFVPSFSSLPGMPSVHKVVVLNASSGATVTTYENTQIGILDATWSPDGHYIATQELTASSNNRVSVWVA